MSRRDMMDIEAAVVAALADAGAVIAGVLLATWIRFDSGWIPVFFGRDPDLYRKYAWGAVVAAGVFLYVFRSLRLYARPQLGTFESKIPRLVRASATSLLVCVVLAYALKNVAAYATLVLALSLVTVTVLILIERYVLFRLEWHYVRHSPAIHRALIVGTDELAVRLMRAVEREPGLRTRVAGFLRAEDGPAHPDIAPERILGPVTEIQRHLEAARQAGRPVARVIVTSSSLPHELMMDVMLACVQNLAAFHMVPDAFRILTGKMAIETLGGVPLLGLSEWPLDRPENRAIKRAVDIVGAAVGLILAAPLLAVAAILIKRSSPGPVFYVQERCGEQGRLFKLYKLRTMRPDAEQSTGPVFATRSDPRVTRVGVFLRRYGLDELPQLWNVLKGDMSLVGPRPERPHFVQKFRQDIDRYMLRHVYKPGLTGWAQVNGLRGNTSIEERIRHDLYYLENWSLALDFKILVKTLTARENAY